MKLKIILFTLAVLFSSHASVYANIKMNIDEKVQKMQTELSLTQEQADKVRIIIQDYKDRMETIRQEKEDKLKAVLSTEQMNRYKIIKQKKYSEKDSNE